MKRIKALLQYEMSTEVFVGICALCAIAFVITLMLL